MCAHRALDEMRILLLTPDPPAITGANGGATRQLQLYRRLIALGHEVTVVAPFVRTKGDLVAELEREGFRVRPYLRPKSRVVEVLGAVLRKPWILLAPLRLSSQATVGAVYWTRLRSVLRGALAEETFDAVCVEQEFAANWVADVPRGITRILICQQVESAYRADRAARMSGIGKRVASLDAERAAAWERRWIPEFDGLVCMSKSEIALLSEVAGSLPHAFVVANGADLQRFAAVGPDPGEGRVLFTGTLAFEPNALAASWLATEVWSRVRASNPTATLEIVGRDPGADVLALDRLPGVSVHADVPEIVPFFSAASVCTAPLTEGGGTRLKLAEAFAATRAVVATTNGATGIDVEHELQLLIADSPADFADAILRLLGDPALRARIAQAGHDFASAHLDWRQLGDDFERAIREIAETDR